MMSEEETCVYFSFSHATQDPHYPNSLEHRIKYLLPSSSAVDKGQTWVVAL